MAFGRMTVDGRTVTAPLVLLQGGRLPAQTRIGTEGTYMIVNQGVRDAVAESVEPMEVSVTRR